MESPAQALGLMTGEIEPKAEPVPDRKKEWTAPELKKIDIQEITANGDFLASDGPTTSS